MKFTIVVKQVDIVEVEAENLDAAINRIKDSFEPRALLEFQVVEEN